MTTRCQVYPENQTNKHAYLCVCVCVYTERERISVTLVTTAAQGRASDLCMCVRAGADSCRAS